MEKDPRLITGGLVGTRLADLSRSVHLVRCNSLVGIGSLWPLAALPGPARI